MPNSQSTVRVAANAVAFFQAQPNTRYKIQFEVDKSNIRLGMIAVSPNFPQNSYYESHVFNPSPGVYPWQEFSYTTGSSTSRLYFYLLLPIAYGYSGTGVSLIFGTGDGEQTPVMNDAAHVTLTYQNPPPVGSNPGYRGGNVRLPAEIIEFSSNFYFSVGPTATSSVLQSTVNLDASGNPELELNTSIHYLSGLDGQVILDVVESANQNQADNIFLPAFNTPNNNMNIIAFVKPTQNGNSSDFLFELGDPERDARIKIGRY